MSTLLAMHSKRSIVFGAALVLASGVVGGAVNGQQTLETLERAQNLETARDLADEVVRLSHEIAQTKERKCMRAFGHTSFCTCIAEQSPVGVTFENYILITTSAKEDLGYSTLPLEDQRLIDGARTARDRCVAKTPPRPMFSPDH